MRVAVVANGEWNIEWGKEELAHYDRLIAVDGGGNHVIESGYIPDVLIGDLDSIQPDNLDLCRGKGTKVFSYPSEKDETDLELALDYAAQVIEQEEGAVAQEQRHKMFYLLGASGGRIDHLLGNLSIMLGFYKSGYEIRMKDPDQEVWLLNGQQKIVGKQGQKVSIIPMTEKAVVRTEGLYYPLHGEILYQDSPRGISNVFLGEDAIVEVSEGMVLIVALSPHNTR